jgi:hypothetical protein
VHRVTLLTQVGRESTFITELLQDQNSPVAGAARRVGGHGAVRTLLED